MNRQKLKYLVEHDPDTLYQLIEDRALSPGLLTHAAEICGKSKSERAKNVLLELLNHPTPVVREGAIYGLENFDAPEVIVALEHHTDLSHETSPGVREAAKEALEYIREG